MHCAIWKKISSGMYNPAQAGNTPTIRKNTMEGVVTYAWKEK